MSDFDGNSLLFGDLEEGLLEAESLTDRNFQVLRRCSADVADLIDAIDKPISRIIGSEEEGSLNIDLGHTAFYDGNAIDYTEQQIDAFIDSPRRITIPLNKRQPDTIMCNQRVATDVLDWMAENGLKANNPVDKDGGYLIVIGLGLGLGITRLLEELPVRNLVIVEQFPEFIRHSLDVADWSQWEDILTERGGSLRILLGRDPLHTANRLYVHLRNKDFGLIDGSYMLMHYQSSFTRTVLDEVVSRIPVIAANPGFFEDELVMMRNAFMNLRRYDHKLLQDRRRLTLTSPVIVVASGPSVDTAVDFIRENQDRAIVITCGTGLGALLGYGIKPDFHVDTENTPGPLEILSGLNEKYDLSDITLVACNTVDPGVPALFKERYLYFRDSVTPSHFFGRDLTPLSMSAPTVSNAAVRAMLTLGFQEIYLVGVDLGSRDKSRHHSEKSIYLADQSFLETHPEHAVASKYSIARQGSLGGTVFANSSFVYAAMFMSGLLKLFPKAKVYNLSDGAKIKGTVPRLPKSVTLQSDAPLKKKDLSLIKKSLDEGSAYPGFSESDLHDLQVAMNQTLNNLAELFRHESDVVALFDGIKEIFDSLTDGPVNKTIYSYLWGSTLMFYQFIYIAVRRLPEEHRDLFMERVAERSADEIIGLREQFKTSIEALVEEL